MKCKRRTNQEKMDVFGLLDPTLKLQFFYIRPWDGCVLPQDTDSAVERKAVAKRQEKQGEKVKLRFSSWESFDFSTAHFNTLFCLYCWLLGDARNTGTTKQVLPHPHCFAKEDTTKSHCHIVCFFSHKNYFSQSKSHKSHREEENKAQPWKPSGKKKGF